MEFVIGNATNVIGHELTYWKSFTTLNGAIHDKLNTEIIYVSYILELFFAELNSVNC